MTKSYSWARSGGTSEGSASSLVVGEARIHRDRIGPRGYARLAVKMQAARANFAGLPIRLRMGDKVYDYADRSQLRAILDDLEALAKAGEASMQVHIVHVMSIKAKRLKEIVVRPGFFTAMRSVIERQKQFAARHAYVEPRTMGLPPDQALLADRIIDKVVELSGHDRHKLLESAATGSRSAGVAKWRQITYWLLADLIPAATQIRLAEHVGKNHTTLLHGIAKVQGSADKLAEARAVSDLIRPVVKDT